MAQTKKPGMFDRVIKAAKKDVEDIKAGVRKYTDAGKELARFPDDLKRIGTGAKAKSKTVDDALKGKSKK